MLTEYTIKRWLRKIRLATTIDKQMPGDNPLSFSLIKMRIINRVFGTKLVKEMLLLNSRKKLIKMMPMKITFKQIWIIKRRNWKKSLRKIIELDHWKLLFDCY